MEDVGRMVEWKTKKKKGKENHKLWIVQGKARGGKPEVLNFLFSKTAKAKKRSSRDLGLSLIHI